MIPRWFWFAVACLLFVTPAHAGDTTLSPEAQQAFDRGLAAAKQQEWGLAARYFTEAQTAAPEASPVLYNLGLAHAKAGHELAAIAWLHAYLAADPQLTNAAAIHAEIERLKSSARGKMTNIFQELATTIRGMEDASSQQMELQSLALYEAMAGEVEAAIMLKPKRTPDDDVESSAWRSYAGALITAGDLAGSEEALAHVQAPAARDDVWRDLVSYHLVRRNTDEARRAAEQMQDPAKRAEALKQVRITVLTNIIETNAVRGEVDLVPVEELLTLETEVQQVDQLASAAEQHAKHGHLEAARPLLQRALQRAQQLSNADDKLAALREVMYAQLTCGELKNAKATATELLAITPSYVQNYLGDIAAAHTLLGNAKAAQGSLDRIAYNSFMPNGKDYAYGKVAFVQAMTGNLKDAKQTAQRAAREFVSFKQQRKSGKPPTHQLSGWCESRIAEALIAQGKLPAALEILRQSQIKWAPFHAGMNQLVDAHLVHGELAAAAEAVGILAREGEDTSGMTGGGDAWRHLLSALEARATTAPQEVRPLASEIVQVLTAFCRRGHALAHDDALQLFQRLAAVQRQAGDSEGARATLTSVELTLWLKLAQFFSTNDTVVNLEQKLRDESTTDWTGQADTHMAISRLTWVALDLGRYLLTLNGLERQLAH